MATNLQLTTANVLKDKGYDLETELTRMRAEGRSARAMAHEIMVLSGHLVVLTGPTVAVWADALPRQEAAAS